MAEVSIDVLPLIEHKNKALLPCHHSIDTWLGKYMHSATNNLFLKKQTKNDEIRYRPAMHNSKGP